MLKFLIILCVGICQIIGSFDSNVSARVAELMEGARQESLSKHVPKL